MEINDLPGEMLMRVFRSLTPRDLKMSVVVSYRWKAVGEDPSLWTWCRVTIRNREDIINLSIGRLQYIQEIRVNLGANWWNGAWEDVFNASITLPRMNKIVWVNVFNLSGLLGSATSRLEDISLCATKIGNAWVFQLKKLDLRLNNLSSVEPELLATAVIKLEEVNLCRTQLSSKQLACLTYMLSLVQEGSTNLKKLFLGGNDLSSVDAEVLAKAVNKLEEVDLMLTKLSTKQLTSILSRVQLDTKLRKLLLQGNKASDVDEAVIRNAKVKLGGGLKISVFSFGR